MIVDNPPNGAVRADVEALEGAFATLEYVPFSGPGVSARELIFRIANADIVCSLDRHVLLRPGALAAILDWFDAHPDSRDLIQGPRLRNDLEGVVATHLDPVWVDGAYGRWGIDERIVRRDGAPVEIGMQELGLFACRRNAWPGLNPRFRGVVGAEGYLHERFAKRADGCFATRPRDGPDAPRAAVHGLGAHRPGRTSSATIASAGTSWAGTAARSTAISGSFCDTHPSPSVTASSRAHRVRRPIRSRSLTGSSA